MSNYPAERNAGKSVRLLALTVPLMFLAAGCHRDDVKVYRIAKDQDQSSQQTAPAPPTDSPNPELPPGHPDISSVPGAQTTGSASTQLTWKTPAGWTEVPPSKMRVGSFKVTGADGKQADVSVIPLPGMAGTDAANVNRWRGQVGLPEVTDNDLQKAAENVEAGGQPAQLYDIAGTNLAGGGAERILGVIQHRDDMAWFYKMTGDADLVEQQKPAFIEFLKSLNFGAAAPTQTEILAGNPTAGGGNIAWTSGDLHLKTGNLGLTDTTVSANTIPLVSHEGQPNWQVPAGWQSLPRSEFLVAKFLIQNGDAQAEVNVAEFAGEAGGLPANVNRWRGQLGLPAVDETEFSKIISTFAIPNSQATLVDYTGTDSKTGKPARLVGAVVPQNGQTWFYKLMGDESVVAQQKDAFIKFIQSAKYPDAGNAP
jgi:hypothetical protein